MGEISTCFLVLFFSLDITSSDVWRGAGLQRPMEAIRTGSKRKRTHQQVGAPVYHIHAGEVMALGGPIYALQSQDTRQTGI